MRISGPGGRSIGTDTQVFVVALFVISQEPKAGFWSALRALRRLYYWITLKALLVNYATADGDKAQYSALSAVVGASPSYRFLMGHEDGQEHIKCFFSSVSAALLRDIYDLHFARGEVECLEMRNFDAVAKIAHFTSFCQLYVSPVAYWIWQIFATPIDFASTNNLAETLNALLKHDYTLRGG